MAWSPVRRANAGILRVEHPGDYANLNSNHLRDGTRIGRLINLWMDVKEAELRKRAGQSEGDAP
jgi:hypothetical protein